jgi:predicted dienelactone hydrolase
MTSPSQLRFVLLVALILLLAPAFVAADHDYNPLSISGTMRSEPLDVTIADTKSDREIPLRVYLPAQKKAAPVVLFSHGLGGSRTGSAYLGNHWAARGYASVFLQHPGSDTSVWQDKPPRERMAAMKKAVSVRNFMLRTQDVSAVLDHLDRQNKTVGNALSGRLDMQRIGMAGHSFGATTTQAVSGQRFLFNVNQTDPRIKAAVMMSPGAPKHGDMKKAFGSVAIPWMVLTGTKDKSLVADDNAESRLKVFPALPPGGKYELVLYNAEHSAFSDRPLPGDREKRNPNHHRAILTLTTAFWDAWLKNDTAAKAWLDGDGPRSVLEQQDGWQRK